MTAWNETLAQYLRILQSEGKTHIELSQNALKTLRALVAKPSSSAVSLSPASRSQSISALSKERAGISVQSSRPKSLIAPVTENGMGFVDLDLKTGTVSQRLERLMEKARGCQQCMHLAQTRNHVVFGAGNPEAKLMFVGEAPSLEDDQEGQPFIGPAGQLLTKMIQAMGVSREEVYIANVMKCRPDMPEGSVGNRKPTTQEMHSCLPYLQAQIQIIEPQIIVALGAVAVEGLFSNKTPMSKLRGTFLNYHGIPVMPTYHPTYLLKNQSMSEKRKVWEDLLAVMEKLALPISEKQRGFFLARS